MDNETTVAPNPGSWETGNEGSTLRWWKNKTNQGGFSGESVPKVHYSPQITSSPPFALTGACLKRPPNFCEENSEGIGKSELPLSHPGMSRGMLPGFSSFLV